MFAESRSVARLLLFTLVTAMLVPAPLGNHHATPNSGPASSMRCTIPILGAGGIRHGVLIYEASSPPEGSAHFSFGVLFNESLRLRRGPDSELDRGVEFSRIDLPVAILWSG